MGRTGERMQCSECSVKIWTLAAPQVPVAKDK